MQLFDGRSKAFRCLSDAIDWMKSQEVPKCDGKITVYMPKVMENFIKEAGPGSTTVRAHLMKSLGIAWPKERAGKKIKLPVVQTKPARARRKRAYA
jgi:hypothetical protein